jgi:hypothetical protein
MGIVYSLLLARLNELNISYFGIQKEFGEQPIAVHCSLYTVANHVFTYLGNTPIVHLYHNLLS